MSTATASASQTQKLPYAPTPTPKIGDKLKAEVKDFNFFYANGFQALQDINMPIAENKVTALIGPSGCGRATS